MCVEWIGKISMLSFFWIDATGIFLYFEVTGIITESVGLQAFNYSETTATSSYEVLYILRIVLIAFCVNISRPLFLYLYMEECHVGLETF
jgi:hypothetical protein